MPITTWGNTQFRLGQKTEKSNPKETIETWQKAVRSYDAALQIEPGDLQAKHNRDLVKQKDRAIEEAGGSEETAATGSEERSQEPAGRPERAGTERSKAGSEE